MKTLILIALAAIISFLIYKFIMVIACRILNIVIEFFMKKKGVKESRQKEIIPKFDLLVSIALQLLFVTIWFASVSVVDKNYGISDLVFYISFCLIGVFCIIWCYFSWDAEHIFIKPCKASKSQRRAKKIVIYSLILVFVLCQGYYQTLHAMDNSVEINILFSVTNYSVIVATIAFDRVMNQICIQN